MPKSSLARKGTLAAAAKQRCHQEDAQQRDSRLAVACLPYSLASNLQVAIVEPSRFCHGSTVVEEPLSKKHRSSEAHVRWASLLVMSKIVIMHSIHMCTLI